MSKPIIVHSEPQYRKGLRMLDRKHKYQTIATVKQVVNLLAAGQQVPAKYKPHKLKGVNQYECHIEADVLLTWRYEEDAVVINLRLLNLTDHDSLSRKAKIHGGIVMKQILGRHRIVTNKRYRRIYGGDGEYVMTPEEEADWNRRWDETFDARLSKPMTIDEFHQIMKEMREFE